jgi:hypothetical protein
MPATESQERPQGEGFLRVSSFAELTVLDADAVPGMFRDTDFPGAV